MTISGITTTADNGVERVTASAFLFSPATIVEECVVSMTGVTILVFDSLLVERSQIRFNADTAFDLVTYADPSADLVVFRDSSILIAALAAGRALKVTELSDTTVVEETGTQQLFVYTAIGAVLQNVLLRGHQVWEITGQPAVWAGVTINDALHAFLNWNAGRLDAFGFAVENMPAGASHGWLGSGGGSNAFWSWNPDASWNIELIYLQTTYSGYVVRGFTATLELIDRDSSDPVEEAVVVFSDDRSGSVVEHGYYVTDVDGHLTGTLDSQFLTTGSDIDRPTLFCPVRHITSVGPDGTYAYPVSTIAGTTGRYALGDVTPSIEIRSYSHQPLAGYMRGDAFAISEEVGRVAADLSVELFAPLVLSPDPAILVSAATALAYAGITVTDHGASPVTWNSKVYSITIEGNLTTNPALTASQIYQQIKALITRATPLDGRAGYRWHYLCTFDGAAFGTQRGDSGGAGATLKGVRIVDQGGNAFPGISAMTADDGTVYTPPITYSITVTNSVGSAEVRIVDGINTIDHVQDVVGNVYTYNYQYSGSILTYTLRINEPGFETYDGAITLANESQSINVTLKPDESYVP